LLLHGKYNHTHVVPTTSTAATNDTFSIPENPPDFSTNYLVLKYNKLISKRVWTSRYANIRYSYIREINMYIYISRSS